ncbi:MAG TPA: VOC family protein [Cellvibrio sp.]|nr:VOC family protein [Cellvibrio sp.]
MLKTLLTLYLLMVTLTVFAADNKTATQKATLTKDEKTMTQASPQLKQRLHIILLGVNDVAKSAAFYEALGWQRAPSSHAGFVKFDLGGFALALISRDDLAKDALEPSPQGSGFSGMALIHLVHTADEVALTLARAVEAGGTLVKPATKTQWGTAGYFRDPDGHLFEVDHEEVWVFDESNHLIVQ